MERMEVLKDCVYGFNWRWLAFAVHLTGLFVYVALRAVYTLDVGSAGYAALILIAEVVWASRSLLYTLGSPEVAVQAKKIEDEKELELTGGYCIRALVYCMREDTAELEKVVQALLGASLPENSSVCVYLVDSKGDSVREDWVGTTYQGHPVQYVAASRIGATKGACLNEAIEAIYGKNGEGLTEGESLKEVVAVLNGDQVVESDFFMDQLPLLRTHEAVFSPCTVECDDENDVHWFGGYKALPSNFAIRINPNVDEWYGGLAMDTSYLICKTTLFSLGKFDEIVVREDHSLYWALKAAGNDAMVKKTSLAVQEGEGGCGHLMQDRKRWCKAHLQLFFSKGNMIFSRHPSIHDKFTYLVAPWMQLTSAFCVPIFILAPVLAIWFGIHPFDVNVAFCISFVVFYSIVFLDYAIGVNSKHMFTLYLADTLDFAFWGISFISLVEIIGGSVCSCFQEAAERKVGPAYAHIRGSYPECGSRSAKGPEKRHWAFVLALILLSFGTAIVGMVLLYTGSDGPYLSKFLTVSLRVSVFWAVYNIIIMSHSLLLMRVNFKPTTSALSPGFLLPIVSLGVVIWVAFWCSENFIEFSEVLSKCVLFYEAQRSGRLPETNRIPWRGDSGLLDVTIEGKSLAGGYYDAGDWVKFGLPLGVTLTVLSWSAVEFEDNIRRAGELDNFRDTIKWGTDYILKCHTGKNELYAVVGDGDEEHSHWDRPENYLRRKIRAGKMLDKDHPGSDVAGASAAALAAAHLVFKDVDKKYSKELLDNAKSIYAFGNNFLGLSSESLPQLKHFYPSGLYRDDLAMAAFWLYKASGDEEYLKESEEHVRHLLNGPNYDTVEFGWNDVGVGVCLLLAQETKEAKYIDLVKSHLDKWLHKLPRTPEGFSWETEWGALRYDANTAFIGLVHAHLVQQGRLPAFSHVFELECYCWSWKQVSKMLGDGSSRSYVVGLGKKFPRFIHHRGASCPDEPHPCGWDTYHSPDPNPHILHGALVGGPDVNGNYRDNRTNYQQNEPSLDYNAGFTGSVAGLISLSKGRGKCYNGEGFMSWVMRDHPIHW